MCSARRAVSNGAVPYGDYFEGILSKKTQAEPGSHIVPLMELVYGDCVALYPHMSEKDRHKRL